MKQVLAVALVVICTLTGAAQGWKKQHEVSIGDFTVLHVKDNLNVVYSNNPDSVGFAQFSIPNDKASAIMFNNNKKGTLTVQISEEYKTDATLPTIYVYSPFLKQVKNTSDSTVRVLHMSPCPEFELNLSGNGKIVAPDLHATKITAQIVTGKGTIIAAGECQAGNLKVVGAGEIQADNLECANLTCALMGTGTIGCTTTGILSVKGAGSGRVFYVGVPKEIKTSQVGSIKVIPVKK